MTLNRARRLGFKQTLADLDGFFLISKASTSHTDTLCLESILFYFQILEHGQKHAAQYKPMTGCFMTLGKKIYMWLCMKMTGNGHI